MLSYDFPLLRPERKMIGFESEEITLNKLRERLRGMADDELIEFGKTVRNLCEGSVRTSNPFKFQIGLQYLTTMDHHMKESFYD
jgi:hypothetical protein